MRLLVAEDDSVTRKLLEVHLTKWGHEVVACDEGSSAWEVIRGNDPPRLVILDWVMPGMDGVTLCREIRNLKERPYIYVILLTARTRKEHIIEGLEAGADDYIVKPFDVHELQVRVRVGFRIVRLQEDLMAALAASDFQATHDALTGIWNRKAIIEKLNLELTRTAREGGRMSVLMADLDHFKRINDTHGHLAGDSVLREVVNRLLKDMRPYDSIGRYGGEEFLILCPGCGSDGGSGVAERLRTLLSQEPIVTSEGVFPVTMSFGVASVQEGNNVEADGVIKRADEALYRAKNSGRNRVKIWEDQDTRQ